MKVTDNARIVLEKRYLLKDLDCKTIETPEELARRVAKTAASCEKNPQEWEDKFFALIDSTEFLPNTPCLINAGKPNAQLFACFVLPVGDSIEEIFDSVKYGALIHKTGGGTGYNFSNIRSAGSIVNSTMGIASGPVSFMRNFDTATETIKQGGVRRGANMGILNVDHAEILPFIRCKSQDGLIENFNISVGMFDSFMKNPDPEIWNAIVDCAWKTGDPGLIFIDMINRANPLLSHLGTIQATNPCQPGWATVLTPDGIRTIDQIDIDSTIWSGTKWTKVVRKVSSGIKEVNQYVTRGGTFYGTDSHNVISEGHKVEASIAETIDTCVGPTLSYSDLDIQAVVDGLVIGDGMMHKASNNKILLCVGDNDSDYHTSEIKDYILGPKFSTHTKCWDIRTTVSYLPRTFDRFIPPEYRYSTLNTVRSFLRGLYSANGSVVSNRVTLKASSRVLIEQVQEMLSALGIRSYYTTNKSTTVQFENGLYECKESYDLNISTDRIKFREIIGFIQGYKQVKLTEACTIPLRTAKSSYEVLCICHVGDEEVFDVTVDSSEHTYWTGGLLVSNCGEVPQYPFEACVLGSIDISKFFEPSHIIDWDRLRYTVIAAVRFLDNLIDVNHYPIPQIEQVVKDNRRIGLGLMGWADLLIKAKIHYDTDQAITLAESLMKFVDSAALECSMELGEEKGIYPNWKHTKGSPKCRNVARTTIAPTGTLSILADCSSGIEPIFDIEFDKNIVDTRLEQRSSFYKENRKWIHTTNEIDVYWHIATQAMFQRYVNNAVSKTINLPSSATREDVASAYTLAWEMGCKGITVYRDGSKQNQPWTRVAKVSNGYMHPRERPEHLDGKTVKVKTDDGNMYVTLNQDEYGPFETFIAIGDADNKVIVLADAIARLISLNFRSGVSPEDVIEQLQKLRSIDASNGYTSIPIAVAKVLEGIIGIEKPTAVACSVQNKNCTECIP